MMDPPILDDDLLAPGVAVELDQVCDRFERAWKEGRQPALEQFLAGSSDCATLLRELLVLELTYRALRGDNCQPEEYQRRFPDRAALIADVFAELNAKSTIERGSLVRPSAVSTLPYGPARAHRAGADTDKAVSAIGKYRLIERLGGGGQGEVFRAVHPKLLGRDVVIKWARQSLDGPRQQQLLAEGQVLARLDDPGLVRVYDVDMCDGRPFIVFEYVAGRTLHDQMKQARPSFRQAALLICQLAATLERVHQKGVLHRDLKPQNVLIDLAGQPRLLDFGLAWLQPTAGAETDRPERGISGTPQYMPPEQARGDLDRLGPHSDVFGLGAIFYEMLTGQPPYNAADRSALWAQARQGRIAPPRQLNPRVPRSLEAICLRALAPDLEQRYPTARSLERALRRYLARPKLALAGVAALVLAAGIAVTVVSLPGRPHAPPGTAGLQTLPQTLLSGDLIVNVWSPSGSKPGMPLDQPGALPVRTGEMLRVSVKLNQPAYTYLILLDSRGDVHPLHPWNPERGFREPPRQDRPIQEISLPEKTADQPHKGWELDEHSGLETFLLLVRRTPLPEDYDLAGRIGQYPSAPLRHPQEFVVRGAGPDGDSADRDLHRSLDAELSTKRGLNLEAKRIDEPLLQVFERLRGDFELIRAVRFAHVSN
jgi:serine/threonine protein kinase